MDKVAPEASDRLVERIADVALDTGRMFMEVGASGRTVATAVDAVSHGLGADRVDLNIGYTSLALTLGTKHSVITRLRKVGPLGVNQQLDQKLWKLASSVSRGEITTEEMEALLARLAMSTPHHALWLIAIAVGLACAAFGRLLGVDWYGTLPVLLASTLGQYTRGKLLKYQLNAFLCATPVAFLSCVVSGLGATWAGSATVTTAMIASVLLLVPGVPAVNAQRDILEGNPTLGGARALTVLMILIFLAAGLWMGRALLIKWHVL